MESLNLNMLANSLPNSNLANAEAELLNNFKAAAHSITTLYRSSRRTSKRAYNAGYAAACQDLLLMIQQGVSAGESSSDPNGGGSPICRVMDYIEARLEAIRSREEEEEEDEEKERERGKQGGNGNGNGNAKTEGKNRPGSSVQKSQQSQQSQQPSGTVTPKPKEHPISAPLTPSTPGPQPLPSTRQPLSALPSFFSPLRPSSAPLPQSLSLSTPQQRKTRASALSKEAVLAAASQSTIPFALAPSPPSSTNLTNLHNFRDAQESALSLDVPLPPVAIISPTPLSPPPQLQLQVPFSHTHTNAPSYSQTYSQTYTHTSTVGTKRRLNTMLLDSGVQGVGVPSGSTRRRTRSSRNLNNAAAANSNNGNSNNHRGSSPTSAGTNSSPGEGGTGEAMDVEEESGRERKRVARR